MKTKGPNVAILAILAIVAASTAAWAAWLWYARRDAIPVVRTYAELRAQEPMVLKDGTKVWIGKEAKSCPIGSGVLVYVLTEGGSTATGSRRWRDQVGPVRIRARRGDESSNDHMQILEDSSETIPARLFTRRIDVTQPGRLRLEALTLESELLKQSHISGEEVELHAWVPWRIWRQDLGPDGLVRGAALPAEPEVLAVAPDTKLPLPVLFPQDSSPTITIARTPMGISVEGEAEMTVHRGMYHFLVRFWVNGRPFIPGKANRWSEGGSGVFHLKSVELKLDLPWSAIGARPGDRIELEILYCPQGVSLVSDAMERMEHLSASLDEASPPRWSNRLEFIAE